MKALKTIYISILTIVSSLTLFTNLVSAESELLPDQIKKLFDLFGKDGLGAVTYLVSRVQLLLVVMLALVVLAAVFYSIIAAIKYISSQGDSGKIEEAQKAIKAIFYGIGAMLISIVGIVLIFAFAGAGLPPTTVTQTCTSAPGSVGCKACNRDTEDTLCVACQKQYADAANGGTVTNLDCIDPLKGGNNP